VLHSITPVPDSTISPLPLRLLRSQTSSSMLDLVIVNSQPWILFTVKSCLLFSSDPAPCAHHSCIFRIYGVSATSCLSLTSHLFHLHFYSCHWLLRPCLDSPMKLSVPNFWKPSSLQRSSSYLTSTLSLWAMFQFLDYFQLQTTSDTSGILRVPECTWNTWTRVQVGTAHKLKPMSELLLVPAE